MGPKTRQLLFETCEAGISSAVAPELLPPNQVPWGMNVSIRGGKPSTRPNIANRLTLPPGLIQGCEFFGIQGGMLVASIAGRIYKLRIGVNDFSVEEVNLSFVNSPIVKQVWMTQTVETLVIQDGQSNPILYDGSVGNRAVSGQVPRGRQMAYGNGRLWVAVNANEAVAGDIRTNAAGSELKFTEATYLTGGGKLYFTSKITGMSFIPVTGQADYGALLVFGSDESNAIRADITARDDWGKVPGFGASILRSVGAASQWSIASVNQDLYWRDSNQGIRSIRNALADEAGPGSSPISREVSRLTDYDSTKQLAFCSSVYFDNRLLMTSSPFILKNGGVGFKNIIPLDFAPLSTMAGKTSPAYDGQWNGLNFVKLVGGKFNGRNRAFALTTDDDGNNQLWEFSTRNRADIYTLCDGTSDGTSEPTYLENAIRSFVEYPLRDFGESKSRKLLQRCDVWLSAVNGDLDLKVYWRADNSQKWLQWDEATTCAKTTDAATNDPHVYKNLLPQERPQFKTFSMPEAVNEITKYATQVGFEFQVRLVWTGRCRIHRMMVYGSLLDDPDYANRDGFEIQCVENDITGNQVVYQIPTGNCPAFVMTYPFGRVRPNQVIHLGGDVPTDTVFTVTNNSPFILYLHVTITGCPGAFTITSNLSPEIPPGGVGSFTIHYDPDFLCEDGAVVVIGPPGGGGATVFTVDDGTDLDPDITVQPVSTCAEVDGEGSFHVTAAHGPLEYDWFIWNELDEEWVELEEESPYSGVNSSTLVINPAAEDLNESLYRVRVRNPNGFVYSDEVELTVGNCGGCACALMIPVMPDGVVTSIYANYAAVTADIAAGLVSECFAYLANPVVPDAIPITFTFSVTPIVSDSFTINVTVAGGFYNPQEARVYSSLNLSAGSILSVQTDFASGATAVDLYSCDGTLLQASNPGFGPQATNFSITDTAIYILLIYNGTTGGINCTWVVSSDGLMTSNPVIALWDDSGTTRQLDACPKLYLPPLTEATGDWYVDCAEALAAIDDYTSNCIGYSDATSATVGLDFILTATDGGSSLTLNGDHFFGSATMFGSVNCAAGETISVAYSTMVVGGVIDVAFTIYDEAGAVVEAMTDFGGSGSGAFVSMPLPAARRYLLSCFFMRSPPNDLNANFIITSSGPFTVNPIQALYDTGLSCPGRLNCGDSCP